MIAQPVDDLLLVDLLRRMFEIKLKLLLRQLTTERRRTRTSGRIGHAHRQRQGECACQRGTNFQRIGFPAPVWRKQRRTRQQQLTADVQAGAVAVFRLRCQKSVQLVGNALRRQFALG
ncbi:hypothetical protein D3C78_1453820 [compost metagenome]